jgi:hypothetical protein
VAKQLIETYGDQKVSFIKLHRDLDPVQLDVNFSLMKYFAEEDFDVIEDYVEKSAHRYHTLLNHVKGAS